MPGGMHLRQWQIAARQRYHAADAVDFLVTATPGAGKTTFALTIAGDLRASSGIEQVIVVCPTDHLRQQWALAALRAGIRLDPTLTNNAGAVRQGYDGYVTTYAQVAAHPVLHRARVNRRATLVILDEVHHAGEGLRWGDALAESFSAARRRLALSGTPFRTAPGETIPFLHYDRDGDAMSTRADFSYSYTDALADGVVRPVVFAAYDGAARWIDSAGAVQSTWLSQRFDGRANTLEAERMAWRTALNPSGQWIPHVMAAMNERLDHQRAHGVPDAAGLIIASTQAHARAYADVAERVTGHRPVLVLSEDPHASSRLAQFRESDQRFAVCVRMISEGVDVPRATTLLFATTCRTELFFAQVVGRVVRSRHAGESATVFVPSVRPLLALAAQMEQDRDRVCVVPRPVNNLADAEQCTDRPGPESTPWVPLGSEARFDRVLAGGRSVSPSPSDAEDIDFIGLPGLLSAEQTAQLLSARDRAHLRTAETVSAAAQATTRTSGSNQEAPWVEQARLRRELNAAVGAASARSGRSHADLHVWAREAVPGPASAVADCDVLRSRIVRLRNRFLHNRS